MHAAVLRYFEAVAAQAMAEHLRRVLAQFGSGVDGERGQ